MVHDALSPQVLAALKVEVNMTAMRAFRLT
jgi:hypothetical protein